MLPNALVERSQLVFSSGHTAEAVRVHPSTDLALALDRIGLSHPNPSLVVVGGASGLKGDYLLLLQSLFTEVLAPLAEQVGASVIDGGTDAGVMKLMGEARKVTSGNFPLIGVAAIGTVILPNSKEPPPEDGCALEQHHSHFVFVPGGLWGDESPWIARVANVMSEEMPSATILINGGNISWQDTDNSIRAQRPVLVIAGSGRTANILADAVRYGPTTEREKKLIGSGLLHAVDLAEGLDVVRQMLLSMLTKAA